MQYSRREEAFRYQFPTPLKGEFQITKINGKKVESSIGKLDIFDISLHGAKVYTEFDFQIDEHEIELTLNFCIKKLEFSIPGTVVYQGRYGGDFVCGIHLNTDEKTRAQITNELKAFAWERVGKEKV